jgi:hypothetical protein
LRKEILDESEKSFSKTINASFWPRYNNIDNNVIERVDHDSQDDKETTPNDKILAHGEVIIKAMTPISNFSDTITK